MSEKQQTEQGPSKEEIVKFLQEQIEVKKVQLELQEINARLAAARADELKALAFIAQITQPQQNARPHTVTQDDIDNNPELQEAGVSVGDEIMIPDVGEEEEEMLEKTPSKKLKKTTA